MKDVVAVELLRGLGHSSAERDAEVALILGAIFGFEV